jgi:RNA polymerase sigma factor (TIGR02999 family)
MGATGALTDLIHRAQAGDSGAAEALFEATYPDLRRLARARLRSKGRDTLLDTTSLVHEWYVRFARVHGLRLEDRVHFMRYASRAMRAVTVDFARRRGAERRGGGAPRVRWTGEVDAGAAGADEILRVNETLDELRSLDARMAQVVELRYFGGMTEAEIGAALGVAERTVRRDWERARLWLAEALRRCCMPRPDVDPAEWSALNRLLEEALPLDPVARERWLSALGPEHAALLPRLRGLLAHQAGTGAAALETLPKLDPDPTGAGGSGGPADRPGELVGPCRLSRRLAEGGMGTVWLAERADGMVQRPVALKLPRGSWQGATLAERMAREREILASLHHPHIARLYDAGVTADGQPWLALEYVEGRSLDAYLAEEKPGSAGGWGSSSRWPGRWRMRTPTWSSTGTSSRRTSSSRRRVRRGCSTSGSRSCWSRGRPTRRP